MKKGYQKEHTPEEKNRIDKILNSIKNVSSTRRDNNPYLETISRIDDTNNAFKYCKKTLSRRKNSYHSDLQSIISFYQYYQNLEFFKRLSDLYVEKYSKNTNALKALAYELQVLKMKDEYINVYENILTKSTKSARAYRDLANIFLENKDYDNSLELYANYLKMNFDKDQIDKIIRNELEWFYFNKENDLINKLNFTPSNQSKEEFSKDIRLVLEWNNPNASFNLEFFNVGKESTIYKNIKDEHSKQQNSTFEEFLISKLGNQNWFINLIYFGDKKEVTYFKATCYYNWGKEEQYHKTVILFLDSEYEKIPLLKLSQKSLLRE